MRRSSGVLSATHLTKTRLKRNAKPHTLLNCVAVIRDNPTSERKAKACRIRTARIT